MTWRPRRCSEATTEAGLSNRSMSNIWAGTDWSTGVVSCHCQVVRGPGLQILACLAMPARGALAEGGCATARA